MHLRVKEPNQQGQRRWTVALAAVFFLLLLLSGCLEQHPTFHAHKGAWEIVPAAEAEYIYVLPDGRRVIYNSPGEDYTFLILDIKTGLEVAIPKKMSHVKWLDEELLYGWGGGQHYAVNLQPPETVKLEELPADSPLLAERIREADSIYAIVVDSVDQEYMLLLLERDPAGQVTGGSLVQEASNLEILLAGIPHETPEPLPYNLDQDEFPSPDGRYYYAKEGYDPTFLKIYSQQGELFNSISSNNHLICYGWAWDSSGVYFQERGKSLGRLQVGPLELLPVQP